MTCQDVTFRRSVVTRAAVSSIDEFELDDEEPMERRQVLVGEEQWCGLPTTQGLTGDSVSHVCETTMWLPI